MQRVQGLHGTTEQRNSVRAHGHAYPIRQGCMAVQVMLSCTIECGDYVGAGMELEGTRDARAHQLAQTQMRARVGAQAWHRGPMHSLKTAFRLCNFRSVS